MVDPITRKETFLAKAGGQDVTTPTPVTREEFFLNEIANGGGSGGGGALVVHDVNGTLDKTWQEIHDAFVSGGVIVELTDERTAFQNAVLGVQRGRSRFSVTVAGQENWSPGTFVADAADGYPTKA